LSMNALERLYHPDLIDRQSSSPTSRSMIDVI